MFQSSQQHPVSKQEIPGYRVRHSLRQLEEFPQKKNDFLKAWKLIKELSPSNPNSFWSIASYHGMPFKERRVEPKDPSKAWDGYCQHANVLFPTWHRFFCLRLEQALQTVLPDGDVALHYWDTTSDESIKEGLPPILLQPTVTIDGDPNVPNPLLNFTFPRPIEGSTDSFYVKPKGYTTVRYPYSGIANPEDAKKIADAHNKEIEGMDTSSTELLQENVKYFITNGRYPSKGTNSVYEEFRDCLDTDDYNIFSNTNSADYEVIVFSCLEQPHNDIHIAIGGFTDPENPDNYYGLIQGANGDMGANETASFDPMFFVHHANIDRVFWIWQRKWGKQKEIKITSEISGPHHESGTSTTGQGPTPNQTPNQELTMDTILYPFQDEYGVPRTSKDCVDIEGQLGYTYSKGSLEDEIVPSIAPRIFKRVVEKLEGIAIELTEQCRVASNQPLKAVFDLSKFAAKYSLWGKFPLLKSSNSKVIHFADRKWTRGFHFKISNLDKDAYPGSFLVRTYVKKGHELIFLGQRGVLDRWERKLCANCQTRRFASLGFRLDVDTPVDPNHIVAHLVSKNPLTGKEIVTNLDVKYQPEAAQSQSEINPTFQIAVRFDEVTN